MFILMYQVLLFVLICGFINLQYIFGKVQVYVVEKQIDLLVFIGVCFYLDMLLFVCQVYIVIDMVKGCVVWFVGIEILSYLDVEQSFDELYVCIQKMIDYLKSFDVVQIDGSEMCQIVLKMCVGLIEFIGQLYLLNFVLFNFFFYVMIVYDILCYSGVEFGKLDYFGGCNE